MNVSLNWSEGIVLTFVCCFSYAIFFSIYYFESYFAYSTFGLNGSGFEMSSSELAYVVVIILVFLIIVDYFFTLFKLELHHLLSQLTFQNRFWFILQQSCSLALYFFFFWINCLNFNCNFKNFFFFFFLSFIIINLKEVFLFSLATLNLLCLCTP